jgi:integrase
MPGKQAKILSLGDVNDLLVFATCTRHPLRNRAIVLLATKAGLRAGEIANLTWVMVVGPTGDIASVIELRDIAAKNGSGRLIPVHPDLGQALAAYRRLSGRLQNMQRRVLVAMVPADIAPGIDVTGIELLGGTVVEAADVEDQQRVALL